MRSALTKRAPRSTERCHCNVDVGVYFSKSKKIISHNIQFSVAAKIPRGVWPRACAGDGALSRHPNPEISHPQRLIRTKNDKKNRKNFSAPLFTYFTRERNNKQYFYTFDMSFLQCF